MKIFRVGNRIFDEFSPYIIAEIGVNHEGDIDKAKEMIDQVASSGGHAAKFQTYKADTLATKDFSPAYWDTSEEKTPSQFELFKKWDNFNEDQYRQLAIYCAEKGIDFLSTPFDLQSVGYLSGIMPFIKVASADLTNIPLLRAIGKTQKPVLMSVGASSHEEIAASIAVLEESGAQEVSLMHCVLRYPTPIGHANLLQIRNLQINFGDKHAIGYSDHTKPDADGRLVSLEIATLFGAVVLEKHFTFDKTLPGNDHYHSMDSKDLSSFVKQLKNYKNYIGGDALILDNQNAAITNARRRVVAASDIRRGELLSTANLIPLRATVGIEIADWDLVLGKKAMVDIDQGAPVTWDVISESF